MLSNQLFFQYISYILYSGIIFKVPNYMLQKVINCVLYNNGKNNLIKFIYCKNNLINIKKIY